MKRTLLAFAILFAITSFTEVFGQCDRLIELSKEALEARGYQLAIERLLDTRDNCPGEKEVINGLIKEAFERIEGEKRMADSALNVANQVLDQLYFYEDKFGLTLKNTGPKSRPKYRYGFIDRKGKEVIPFEFEESTPFSINDGYARVKKEGKKFLVDTTGLTFQLAETFEELTPSIQAIDFSETFESNLPNNIGDYSELKIFLKYVKLLGGISALPKSISKLKKLEVLNLKGGQLSELPFGFGQLNQLKYLDLSSNQLSSLPDDFGNLSQLKYLNLGSNQLNPLISKYTAAGLQSKNDPTPG